MDESGEQPLAQRGIAFQPLTVELHAQQHRLAGRIKAERGASGSGTKRRSWRLGNALAPARQGGQRASWRIIAAPFSAIFITGALTTLFKGDYALMGRVTSLIFALGLIVILFAPETSQKQLED